MTSMRLLLSVCACCCLVSVSSDATTARSVWVEGRGASGGGSSSREDRHHTAKHAPWGLLRSCSKCGSQGVTDKREKSNLNFSKLNGRSQLARAVLQMRGGAGASGGGGAVEQIPTLTEVENILDAAGDRLVCLDFTATWCGPCQSIAPVVSQLAEEMKDVIFLKIDVDENQDTAQKYDVFQMPTFVFVKKGAVVDQFSGANAGMLRARIEALSDGAGGVEEVKATKGKEDDEEEEVDEDSDDDEGAGNGEGGAGAEDEEKEEEEEGTLEAQLDDFGDAADDEERREEGYDSTAGDDGGDNRDDDDDDDDAEVEEVKGDQE